MYTCIKDPETGRRLYVDAKVETRATIDFQAGICDVKVMRVDAGDVVTENDFVETVLWQLRGVVIKNTNLLKTILEDAFGISVETCPELMAAVEERLNEARLEGIVL